MTPTLVSMPLRAREDRHGGDPDAELLAALRAGDPSALAGLYDRYGRVVYSLALRLVGDGPAAQDIAQEVFLAIWRGAAGYQPGRGSVRSWILAHAHHKSVDLLRRRRLRAAEPLTEWIASEVDVSDDVLRQITQREVRSMLNALPCAQHQVIAMAYYDGFTQQEIAGRLGVPLGTVKTRIRDGLRRLRGLLDTEGMPRFRRADTRARPRPV